VPLAKNSANVANTTTIAIETKGEKTAAGTPGQFLWDQYFRFIFHSCFEYWSDVSPMVVRCAGNSEVCGL
jgi:hypothetical protein